MGLHRMERNKVDVFYDGSHCTMLSLLNFAKVIKVFLSCWMHCVYFRTSVQLIQSKVQINEGNCKMWLMTWQSSASPDEGGRGRVCQKRLREAAGVWKEGWGPC